MSDPATKDELTRGLSKKIDKEECEIHVHDFNKMVNNNFYKFCGVVAFVILVFLGMFYWTGGIVSSSMASQAEALSHFKEDTFTPFEREAIKIHERHTLKAEISEKKDQEVAVDIKEIKTSIRAIEKSVAKIERNGNNH